MIERETRLTLTKFVLRLTAEVEWKYSRRRHEGGRKKVTIIIQQPYVEARGKYFAIKVKLSRIASHFVNSATSASLLNIVKKKHKAKTEKRVTIHAMPAQESFLFRSANKRSNKFKSCLSRANSRDI